MNNSKIILRSRRPDITFSRSGKISLTSRIVKSLQLRPGDAINITLDNGEFLLYAIHNPVGKLIAQCWPSQKGSRHFCANSVALSRAILDHAGVSSSKAAFYAGYPFSFEDSTFIPIITKNPIIL